MHTNLRSAIFSLNVSEGGLKEYEAVKEEYLRTDSVDGKEICLAAMGRTKDEALVEDYLNFVFSDKVAIQDMHSGAVSLAANSKVRHLLWEYIKSNWTSVEARLSSNNVVFERFIRMGLSKFADHRIGDDITSFFQSKNTGAYERALVIISDNIRTNASYKEREEALVLEWLQAHGYAWSISWSISKLSDFHGMVDTYRQELDWLTSYTWTLGHMPKSPELST